MSILGEMHITRDTITLAREGTITFDVVRYDGKEYILKINKDVDSGLFMRVGPIAQTQDCDMEVAFYESKAKALAPRKERTSNANSWGIYFRDKTQSARSVTKGVAVSLKNMAYAFWDQSGQLAVLKNGKFSGDHLEPEGPETGCRRTDR